jgi:homoserine kinase type II
MGIKSTLTCKEAKTLFSSYKIDSLTPSTSGIIDTTYISEEYIIKRYERSIDARVQADIKLLKDLKDLGLNVARFITQKKSWYLYERLKGEMPTHIRLYHIVSLARFLAKFHNHTYRKTALIDVVDKKEVENFLQFLKYNFYFYYKKLSSLKKYKLKNDGIIHGDIFKDNTLFQMDKVAVFDFIDGGNGSFIFDIAVLLSGFGIKKHHHCKIELFLKTYNQHAPLKQSKKELLHAIDSATYFYTLKRIYKSKKSQNSLLKRY